MRFSRTTFARSAGSLLLLSWALGTASLCKAGNITYIINQAVVQGVTGDIVTDGTIGNLINTSIVDWNLSLNDGIKTFGLLGPLSGANSSFIDLAGSGDLAATATNLSFNFNGPGTNYFFFASSGSPQSSLCFASSTSQQSGCGGAAGVSGEVLEVLQDTPLFYSLSGTQVIGTAASSSVPEPSSLALVCAGIALLAFQKKTIGLRRGVR
jgi:hypothetical protein